MNQKLPAEHLSTGPVLGNFTPLTTGYQAAASDLTVQSCVQQLGRLLLGPVAYSAAVEAADAAPSPTSGSVACSELLSIGPARWSPGSALGAGARARSWWRS
mmetsp:Transcript_20624/g.52344  ORF Transcript_20624/g.52344 Transcript_20624/m.52344 type:complete len:102 (+) Transcript_20624:1288-1593(+)